MTKELISWQDKLNSEENCVVFATFKKTLNPRQLGLAFVRIFHEVLYVTSFNAFMFYVTMMLSVAHTEEHRIIGLLVNNK
jgi:hypothetical protein